MFCNILDFGAKPNTMCTDAIQAAIDACANAGGGCVVIPSGLFFSGTVRLKSHVELHLETGATLKGSDNLDDYNALDEYPQNWGSKAEQWVGKHLILAVNVQDVAVTGFGTIDGRGDAFFGEPGFADWQACVWHYGLATAKSPDCPRAGQLLTFIESQDIRVQDVTLTNMPSWGCFLHGCQNAQIRGLRVFNPPYAANTDGIDIDSCRNVTVSDCIIDTGDDAIAIRCDAARLSAPEQFPCEYITVSNCVLACSSSAFRIGVGTGIIRHVQISNITVRRSGCAVHLMTSYCGRGHAAMEDVHFAHLTACETGQAILIEGETDAPVRHISVSDFRCESWGASVLTAAQPKCFSDIALRNIDLRVIPLDWPLTESVRQARGETFFSANNIEDLSLEHLQIEFAPGVRETWTNEQALKNCTLR